MTNADDLVKQPVHNTSGWQRLSGERGAVRAVQIGNGYANIVANLQVNARHPPITDHNRTASRAASDNYPARRQQFSERRAARRNDFDVEGVTVCIHLDSMG